MKIQQHDGVVVDAVMIAAGLCRASARGRGVAGEREAPRLEVRLPSLPPLYRPLGGAPALGSHLHGGQRPRGETSPQVRWGAPHPQGFQP